MSNPLYEPRGCPTPGACSAAHILERKDDALKLAEEALAIRASLRDGEQGRVQRALDAVREALK